MGDMRRVIRRTPRYRNKVSRRPAKIILYRQTTTSRIPQRAPRSVPFIFKVAGRTIRRQAIVYLSNAINENGNIIFDIKRRNRKIHSGVVPPTNHKFDDDGAYGKVRSHGHHVIRACDVYTWPPALRNTPDTLSPSLVSYRVPMPTMHMPSFMFEDGPRDILTTREGKHDRP